MLKKCLIELVRAGKMRRFFVKKDTISDIVEIVGKEHNHIRNVLRHFVGDEIIVCCGDEYDYICVIEKIGKEKTICRVKSKEINDKNPKTQLTVFQALIKKDNMNTIVQKLNELGVSKLIPTKFNYCVVKGSENKTEKLQEIANLSCKQCGRSMPLNVGDVVEGKSFYETLKEYDKVVLANERAGENSLLSAIKNVDPTCKTALIVGPEGGFDENELQLLTNLPNVININLGKRILRSETAAIALSAVLLAKMQEF